MAPRPTVPLTGPDVWDGSTLAASPEHWLRRLTADELGALDDAATRLVASGWPDALSDLGDLGDLEVARDRCGHAAGRRKE